MAVRGHVHRWEQTVVPCDEGCGEHKAVRCADEPCPLHAAPIDIARFADPRELEAKIAAKRAELETRAEATRAAYRAYTDLDREQTEAARQARDLEDLYRRLVTARAD